TKTKTRENKSVRLYVPPAALKEIREHFEGVATSLEKHFMLAPAKDFDPTDVALADQAAAALADVVHSSDTDCPYYACVMAGADLEDDAEFFGALDISQKAKTKVGGYDNPVLVTIYGPQNTLEGTKKIYEENHPTIGLMTNLGEDEVEAIDDY